MKRRTASDSPPEASPGHSVSRLGLIVAGLLSAVVGASPAHADDAPPWCEEAADTLSPTRWLRAASLSIRGRVPSVDELGAIVTAADAEHPEAIADAAADIVDGWLESDDFADRFVRLHRELFWNNVSDQRPHAVNVTLSPGNGTTTMWARLGTMANRFRGRNVRCLNTPATFGPDGEIETVPQADGSSREGWVWVSPFWDPDNPIKVCAFDAQARLVSQNGIPCNSNQGLVERDCGCGPNLRWCASPQTIETIMRSMATEMDLRVRDIVKKDRPYLDLFTSTRGYVNGPLVHFFRHQTALTRMRVAPTLLDPDSLPDLPFTAVDTWVEVDYGPQHAGLLTSPSYLLRFQTDRARANRFYTAFLCQPFNPPAGGLPVADEASIHEPDLQLRDGCSYCHALLEPAAAHWGRWGERGMSWLDPRDYPAYDSTCATCARANIPCPTRCTQDYVLRAASPQEERWTGWLLGYTFRRDEHMRAIEEGPAMLAYASTVDGRLQRCVVRTALERVLPDAAAAHDDALIDALAQRFVSSGFKYREVIRELVRLDAFRRVR